MRKISLRSLWSHKRRLISTVISIVLGVAFMSGTFVFADTLDKVFDDLFAQANENVDAQVQGEILFSSGFAGDQRGLLDPAVLEAVRGVDGVAAAEPFVITFGFGSVNRIVDENGDEVGAAQGPPTLIESWVADELMNPYELLEGSRAPAADNEIALNVAAAEEGEFELGDTVGLTSQFGRVDYTLVGIFRFGDADSSAGAVSADFTLAEAQRLAGTNGRLSSISARADDGVSQEELVRRITPVLPDGAEAITGEEAASQLADSVQEGFEFFQVILVVFAGIALLVGTFIIANTFSILVAQRTRELALLRAVGASRRQVMTSVLAEAAVVGLVAALLGLLAGIALAAAVRALLEGIGADFPTTNLVISTNTVITAFVVGVAVTAVAAVTPAIRATRVPPLAAIRSVAIDRSAGSLVRMIIGVLVLLLAVFNLSRAWTADGDTDVVPTVGFGALLTVVGAIILGPLLAGRSVRLLGSWLPRVRGVTGRLARENAARSPRRTSATASAILIGVALIGFITIFAESAKASVQNEVDRGVKADLIVQAEQGFGPPSGFTVEAATRVAELPEVGVVSPLGFGNAHFTYPDGDDSNNFISAIDPAALEGVLEFRMEEGDLHQLTDQGIAVDRQIAQDNDLALGDVINVVFPGGETRDLTIQGISDDLTVLGFWTITRATFVDVYPEPLDAQLFIGLAEGADLEEARAAIEEAVSFIPSIEVLDREELVGDLAAQLTTFVNVIYGLLAMSIIIALIGIGNTLSLSIHERTRELGLLRAVGMLRNQVKSAIRWEAVLISVLGTLVGLTLGLILSFAQVKALEGFGLGTFAVPVGSLVFVVILAALFGVLASMPSARRAAKLDVLHAIASE